MFFDQMTKIYDDLEFQVRYGWCKSEDNKYYPFDFCIPSKKIIIELDGDQHFKDIKIFKKRDHNEQRERDVLKTFFANKQGYSVVRLLQTDVLKNKNNWKDLIMNEIERIENSGVTSNSFISMSDIYAQHVVDVKLKCKKYKINIIGV